MKYRIKHDGPHYIAQRKRWFGWQTLRLRSYWSVCEDIMSPPARLFVSVAEAEGAIKTAIIASGLSRAHQRVAKTLPPWSKL